MNLKSARRMAFARAFTVLGCLALLAPQSGQSSLGARPSAPAHNELDSPKATTRIAANPTVNEQALRAAAGKTLMNSPLGFEANRGQFDSSVAFIARAAGADVYLAEGEALIAPRNPAGDDPARRKSGSANENLRMRLVGARKVEAEGIEPARGRVNYLIGDDPRRWVTDAQTFARVRYREVYAGIDLVYYGNGRQLEYDWVVSPGAGVAQIKTVFDGAENLRIDESGDLIARTAGGEIRQQRPFAYQEGPAQRRPVECRYVIGEGNQIGLQVGDYDRTRPLIIDPTLVFATFFGGRGSLSNPGYNSGWEDSYAIAVDGKGDIYIAGATRSRNLPTLNALQSEPGAPGECIGEHCLDVFIAKLNQNGLIYSTYIGGARDEEAYDIAVDAAGSAYITGYTNSVRFPVSDGAAQPFNRGVADAFALKLAPSGSAMEYGTYLGGGENDYGFSLAVDKGGCVYVTGATRSPDFPVNNAFQFKLGGDGFSSDAFVAKLDPLGTSLIYSTYFGGAGRDGGNGVAVDGAGNVYLTGATTSSDFPVWRALQRYYAPGYDSDLGPLPDAFITKFDPTGRELIFSTYLGSWGPEVGNAIALDKAGNVYIAGSTGPGHIDNEFPLVNPLPLAHRFIPNPFASTGMVVKLSADGSQLLYSTFLGGIRYADSLNDIAVDAAGRIYVIGSTVTESGLPLTADTLDPKPGLFTADAFLSALDPAKPGMAALIYSTVFGGSGEESGNALAVDSVGNIYLTGRTTIYGNPGPNNIPTVNSLQSYGPIADAYVAKIAPTFDNSADPIPPAITITSPAVNTFTTTEGAIDLAGVASDNKGVAFVLWTSDRAGVGLAQGADAWNIKQLPLLQGLNRITITARDAAGNTANAMIEVDFHPPYLISIVAGVFEFGLDGIGDGGLAAGAMLRGPSNVLADAAGNLYIADNGDSRIRKVTPDGIISTFVGSGVAGFGGDGGPATAARVNGLGGMAIDSQGNFYFTDYWNFRVRKVTPAGIITTVAGSGDPWPAQPQSSGDGGPATQARLNFPADVAVDSAGNLYINDSGAFRIRKVDTSGVITTIAGTGVEGDTGDGGPATEARISGARSLNFDSAGNLYFIVSYGIRRISPDGRISALQGSNLQPPFAPRALDVDAAGNIYFNETNRVRLRDTAGNFETLAGRGGEGALGSETAALAARFLGLQGITVDGKGNVYVVDRHRVLKLSPAMTGDRSAPTLAITAPATGSNVNSDLPFVTLSGVAADDRGVFQVTWRNNRAAAVQRSARTRGRLSTCRCNPAPTRSPSQRATRKGTPAPTHSRSITDWTQRRPG